MFFPNLIHSIHDERLQSLVMAQWFIENCHIKCSHFTILFSPLALTYFLHIYDSDVDLFSAFFFPPQGWRLSHANCICLTTLFSMSQQFRSRFTIKQLRRRPLWVAANRWRSSEAARLLLAARDDLLTAVARQEYRSSNKRWELWLSWIVSPLGQAGWQLWPFTDICLDAYACMKVCFNGTLSNHLLHARPHAGILTLYIWRLEHSPKSMSYVITGIVPFCGFTLHIICYKPP